MKANAGRAIRGYRAFVVYKVLRKARVVYRSPERAKYWQAHKDASAYALKRYGKYLANMESRGEIRLFVRRVYSLDPTQGELPL